MKRGCGRKPGRKAAMMQKVAFKLLRVGYIVDFNNEGYDDS
jgi:hypothetical protein